MNVAAPLPIQDGPGVERIRHEVRIRSLQVQSVARVTPNMLRVTLCGEELHEFRSLGFDDHVKILVPTGPGTFERRDYTPRRYDAAERTLAIDFALHDAGPATLWALGAKAGDTVQVAGPKGSAVVSPDVRRWLLVGDETALPAISRRIEEAGAGTHLTSVVAVPGPEDEQFFATQADLTTLWAHRPASAAGDPGALLATVRTLDLRPDTFVWVAAEAGVARAVRDHLVERRGHPRAWVKAGGYWIMGKADAHERIG